MILQRANCSCFHFEGFGVAIFIGVCLDGGGLEKF